MQITTTAFILSASVTHRTATAPVIAPAPSNAAQDVGQNFDTGRLSAIRARPGRATGGVKVGVVLHRVDQSIQFFRIAHSAFVRGVLTRGIDAICEEHDRFSSLYPFQLLINHHVYRVIKPRTLARSRATNRV